MQVCPLFCLCIVVGQAAGTGTPQDPTGSRAVALQQKIDAAIAAGESAAIPLSGVYNFSDTSLHLEGCDGLSLLGDGEATTTLLFQGGDRFPKPEPPRKKVLVHGDGGADTMKPGFRLYPNPMAAAGGTYRNGSDATRCQGWCASNATCKGAVFVRATSQCYSLPTVLSFYPFPGMESWSKIPVQAANGPPGGGWRPKSGFVSGVNVTNCANSAVKRLSIDYEPKPRSLFCFADGDERCREGPLGITLHFFNSSRMTADEFPFGLCGWWCLARVTVI